MAKIQSYNKNFKADINEPVAAFKTVNCLNASQFAAANWNSALQKFDK